jgi:hypothetical protein
VQLKTAYVVYDTTLSTVGGQDLRAQSLQLVHEHVDSITFVQ